VSVVVALAVCLAVFAAAAVGGAQRNVSEAGSCVGRLVSLPSPFGYADVTVAPSGDVWVVGERKQFEPPTTARWNGSRWQMISAPANDSSFLLEGIDFAEPDDGWAVGGSGDARDIAIHWDGKHWSDVQGADLGNRNVRLFGVAALTSTNAWAVGFSQIFGSSAPVALIEHWDGRRWRVVRTPNPGAQHSELYTVTAASANDVWAVGSRSTDGSYLPTLVEHWDGRSWRIPTFPFRLNVAGVTALPSGQLLISGLRSGRQVLKLRDGTEWRELPAPPIVGGAGAVSAASTDNVWVSGAGDRGLGGDHADPVAHWDGHAWQHGSAPKLGGNPVHLFTLAAAPNGDAWAVGQADGLLKDVVVRFSCAR